MVEVSAFSSLLMSEMIGSSSEAAFLSFSFSSKLIIFLVVRMFLLSEPVSITCVCSFNNGDAVVLLGIITVLVVLQDSARFSLAKFCTFCKRLISMAVAFLSLRLIASRLCFGETWEVCLAY